jgi:hypothetical protein
MEEEDMNREMYELARTWMAESKLRKLPGHISKDTNLILSETVSVKQEEQEHCTDALVSSSNVIPLWTRMYDQSPTDSK